MEIKNKEYLFYSVRGWVFGVEVVIFVWVGFLLYWRKGVVYVFVKGRGRKYRYFYKGC